MNTPIADFLEDYEKKACCACICRVTTARLRTISPR